MPQGLEAGGVTKIRDWPLCDFPASVEPPVVRCQKHDCEATVRSGPADARLREAYDGHKSEERKAATKSTKTLAKKLWAEVGRHCWSLRVFVQVAPLDCCGDQLALSIDALNIDLDCVMQKYQALAEVEIETQLADPAISAGGIEAVAAMKLHIFARHEKECEDDADRQLLQNPTCDQGPTGVVVEKLRACTRCWSVAYCSKQCQRDDWASHKVWCSARPKPKGADKLPKKRDGAEPAAAEPAAAEPVAAEPAAEPAAVL